MCPWTTLLRGLNTLIFKERARISDWEGRRRSRNVRLSTARHIAPAAIGLLLCLFVPVQLVLDFCIRRDDVGNSRHRYGSFTANSIVVVTSDSCYGAGSNRGRRLWDLYLFRTRAIHEPRWVFRAPEAYFRRDANSFSWEAVSQEWSFESV